MFPAGGFRVGADQAYAYVAPSARAIATAEILRTDKIFLVIGVGTKLIIIY
jgi:hypothetical protein